MKKCASCTKDLPEAALHCVFCGAKQPPAPAVQPGLAKTAFGYSHEMMAQLRQPPTTAQSPAPPMPPPAPPLRPSAQVMPRPSAPSQPPPIAAANAATLFIDNGVPQVPAQSASPAYAQTMAAPNNPAMQPTLAAPPSSFPQPLQPMRSSAPSQPPPLAPMRPSAPIFGMPPNGYPAPVPQPQHGYPSRQMISPIVEPWRESLKLVMIVWGLLVIAALATPLTIDPSLTFSWDALIHGEGTARIPFIVESALGVLGVVVALLPMPAIARGALAALLGLGAIAAPIAISGEVPEWHQLMALATLVVIVPSLLMRAGYPDAILPRMLVTACVIAAVLPELVPQNGHIPLIDTMKALMDAPGKAKVDHILHIARLVLIVLTLLVWMPAPTTAGGTMFAWLIMLTIGLGISLLDVGVAVGLDLDHATDLITKTPAALITWVVPTACLALSGYGLATVVGKQLE